MEISNLKKLSATFPAALEKDIESAEASLYPFPKQLRNLYRLTNGFMTPLGVTAYDIESIKERNETYEISVYCPGYLLFGDDSGGRGFLLNMKEDDTSIYSSDLGDLGPEDFQVESPNLESWITHLL